MAIPVVRKLIYVLPIGFDLQRIMKFPYDIVPTICYLVTQSESNGQTDEGRSYVKKVFEDLVKQNIESYIIGCTDFFDMFDIMACYRWIADNHVQDQVFINVSGGSKLTAMAGMVIAGIYTHVNCYYSRVTVKNGVVDSSAGIKDTTLLPKFQIDPPKHEHIELLKLLHQHQSYSKKEVLGLLLENDMMENTIISEEDSKPKQRSPQALFNALKRNFIEPMVEEGYLYEENNQILLADKGSGIRKIFENVHFNAEKL